MSFRWFLVLAVVVGVFAKPSLEERLADNPEVLEDEEQFKDDHVLDATEDLLKNRLLKLKMQSVAHHIHHADAPNDSDESSNQNHKSSLIEAQGCLSSLEGCSPKGYTVKPLDMSEAEEKDKIKRDKKKAEAKKGKSGAGGSSGGGGGGGAKGRKPIRTEIIITHLNNKKKGDAASGGAGAGAKGNGVWHKVTTTTTTVARRLIPDPKAIAKMKEKARKLKIKKAAQKRHAKKAAEDEALKADLEAIEDHKKKTMHDLVKSQKKVTKEVTAEVKQEIKAMEDAKAKVILAAKKEHKKELAKVKKMKTDAVAAMKKRQAALKKAVDKKIKKWQKEQKAKKALCKNCFSQGKSK